MSYGLRMAARLVLVAIFTVLAINLLGAAFGQSIGPLNGSPSVLRLSEVCPGYQITRSPSKNEVYIKCPPRIEPWLTIRECAQPVVIREPDNQHIRIECTKPIKA